MKQFFPALLVGLTLLSWGGPGLTQQPFGRPPYVSPAVSPYVNLNRPGTNPAINYYGLVRPQLQFYGGIQTLQQEVAATQASLATGFGPVNAEPTTGVAAGFLTQGRFFMTRGSTVANRGTVGLATQGRTTQTPTSTGARPVSR